MEGISSAAISHFSSGLASSGKAVEGKAKRIFKKKIILEPGEFELSIFNSQSSTGAAKLNAMKREQ